MKAPLRERRVVILVLVVLFAMGAWTFSVSASEQKTEPGDGQSTVKLPLPVDAAQPAPTTAEATQVASLQPPFTVTPETTFSSYPPEYIPLIKKTAESLMGESFSYIPVKALDPFVPFTALENQARAGEEDEQNGAPLTPLQKMTLTEITNGLKAITWGELGKRAVIEDSTGKGYIVSVGTPAGEHNGVITQINNDHLIIEQQIWDRKARKRSPQDFSIKLSKKTDEKK